MYILSAITLSESRVDYCYSLNRDGISNLQSFFRNRFDYTDIYITWYYVYYNTRGEHSKIIAISRVHKKIVSAILNCVLQICMYIYIFNGEAGYLRSFLLYHAYREVLHCTCIYVFVFNLKGLVWKSLKLVPMFNIGCSCCVVYI